MSEGLGDISWQEKKREWRTPAPPSPMWRNKSDLLNTGSKSNLDPAWREVFEHSIKKTQGEDCKGVRSQDSIRICSFVSQQAWAAPGAYISQGQRSGWQGVHSSLPMAFRPVCRPPCTPINPPFVLFCLSWSLVFAATLQRANSVNHTHTHTH